jgi:hypothetical protein
MRRIILAASSVLFLALSSQAGCGDSSSNPGDGGTGGSSGSGGAPATGGSSGTGGSAGTGGASGSGGRGGSSGGADAGRRDGSSGGADAGRRDGATTADTGGASADTWNSFARGFFTTYCGSCHNDDMTGTASRDYHLLENVVREKARIACGVSKSATYRTSHSCGYAPGQFPVGGGPKPSDADRERLVNWIEAGTP